MNEDLDKMTWAEYTKQQPISTTGTHTTNIKSGYTKEKLLQVVQTAEITNMKMFIWTDTLQNYVRVYRNSMVTSINKCNNPEKITIQKQYKEIYFK